MRLTALLFAAALAIGLPAAADEAADAASDTASAGEPAADAAELPTKDLVPCGCGGPKAIYAAQYGSVQPPQFRDDLDEPAGTAPAAPESDSADGG